MKSFFLKPLTMALMVASVGLSAQERSGSGFELEEIIVTATKTGAKSLQDVPLAISAFSGNALEEAGQVNIEDIAASTPGLAYTSNGSWAIISIRGVGTNNVFAGGDADTTLQVDGVYYGRPTGGNLDFLDVERVEVLRGPQGTLYGRNAIAGTINVITKDPGNDVTGTLKYTLGNYGLVRPELSFSMPLIEDRLSFGIAARYNDRDGYVRQLNPALPDQAGEETKAVRSKLKFTPNDDVAFVLAADFSEGEGPFNFATVRLSPPAPDGADPSFFETALSHRNYFTMEQWGVSGTLNWELSENYSLTSITAYRESDANLEGDLDYSLNELFHTRYFPENQDQLSQEINLTAQLENLELVTGLFYYREDINSLYNANLFNSLLATQGIDVSTKSTAVFAQGNYSLTDRLSATVGLRYTKDTKDVENIDGVSFLDPTLPGGGEPADPSVGAPTVVVYSEENEYDAWTPKFGLEYQLTDDTLTYASVTKGFKSGGNNLLINAATAEGAAYGPETVVSYELGLKTSFDASVAGTFNAVAFYSDFKGLQVNQFVFLPSGAAQIVSNAEGAIVQGLELELALNLTEQISIGGSLALLDATYDGEFTVGRNFADGTLNADGQDLSDAPSVSSNLYAQYDWQVGHFDLSLRAEAQYKGDVFYSPENNLLLGSEAYWLANLGLRVSHMESGWEFGANGKNLFEEEYVTAGYYAFSAAGQPGEPRIVNAYIKYHF